jgi:periplasmic protein TonB
MKKNTILWVAAIFGFLVTKAQNPYFEGNLYYSVTVKSKLPSRSDEEMASLLATSNHLTVLVKNGNYKQSFGNADIYYILKDKRIYLKFRKLDTLYYRDYSDDNSVLTSVVKSDSIFDVYRYRCKEITIITNLYTSRYYYSDSLRVNPDFDRDDAIGGYNRFSKETNGALYLWAKFEYPEAVITDSCSLVERKPISDQAFDLPLLPQKRFTPSSMFSSAKYPGGGTAWTKYLQRSLDGSLAIKYLKIGKNESGATQTVKVAYVVTETGMINDVRVLNASEVNPHLAEEAMRVIRESPRWIPGSVYGDKIASICTQPVVFQVQK